MKRLTFLFKGFFAFTIILGLLHACGDYGDYGSDINGDDPDPDAAIYQTSNVSATIYIKYNDLAENITNYRGISIGGPISWTGSQFEGQISETGEGGSTGSSSYTYTKTVSYSGSVESSGDRLKSFTGSFKYIAYYKSDGKLAFDQDYAFSISSIDFPIDDFGNVTTAINVTGSGYVSNISVSRYSYRLSSPSDHEYFMIHEEFNSVDGERLSIGVNFSSI